MNIGAKMQKLYKSRNCKNWKDFSDFVGIKGDWCLELSKRTDIATVDITRLIKICNKFNITMDWLLSEEELLPIQVPEGLPTDDIGLMIDKVMISVSDKSKFYGTQLNKSNSKLIIDALDEVKRLIKDNL